MSTQTGFSRFISSLRAKTSGQKEGKHALAEKYLRGFEKLRGAISLSKGPIETAALAASTLLSFREVAEVALGIVSRPGPIRSAAITLIANSINDTASRMNEVANILESLSNDVAVTTAISSAQEAVSKLQKHVSGTRSDQEGPTDDSNKHAQAYASGPTEVQKKSAPAQPSAPAAEVSPLAGRIAEAYRLVDSLSKGECDFPAACQKAQVLVSDLPEVHQQIIRQLTAAAFSTIGKVVKS